MIELSKNQSLVLTLFLSRYLIFRPYCPESDLTDSRSFTQGELSKASLSREERMRQPRRCLLGRIVLGVRLGCDDVKYSLLICTVNISFAFETTKMKKWIKNERPSKEYALPSLSSHLWGLCIISRLLSCCQVTMLI